MASKQQFDEWIGRGRKRLRGLWENVSRSPWQTVAIFLTLTFVLVSAVTIGFAWHAYWTYSRIVDSKLDEGVLLPAAQVYSAPDLIERGYKITPEELIARLQAAGYSGQPSPSGAYYQVVKNSVRVYPGAGSYVGGEPVAIDFAKDSVRRIVPLNGKKAIDFYRLEPRLVTSIQDRERAKRRLVEYNRIPAHLRNAILAIEDHRFFQHGGIDMVRTAKAAYEGVAAWEKPRGTSTLTQQLARGFFLSPDRTYRRKFAELLISLELEERLTKEQIFEYYVNHVSLGQQASFAICGMGEAADRFFGKDLKDITLDEAAMLAGMVQRPSALNPYRYPERAAQRRNAVLDAMLRRGYITPQQRAEAAQAPIKVVPPSVDTTDAPYFVDLVDRELKAKFSEKDMLTRGFKVYSTLDPNLQQIAVEASNKGMEAVEAMLQKQRRWKGKEVPSPQVALVALDPTTGAVKALVGGRSYARSQLNRALAERQPGSAFKPFVYAAALDPNIGGLTPASLVDDEETVFEFGDEQYAPTNFGKETHGAVTLRRALRKSLNIATVKVSEQVGYRNVAALARRAGMGSRVRATPSLALGTYEVSPLEMAGAYTVFANGGVKVKPYLISAVQDPAGDVAMEHQPQTTPILDPRVAFLVNNMLEDVVNRGTAYEARARGFTAPAAGKTGTDDDGWFVGYTSNLLCVVWVGFDDNTDLGLEGAKSALPIWTDFMKRAVRLPAYRNPAPFPMVEGIGTARIDPETGQLATPDCPESANEVFIQGSEPTEKCELHRHGFFDFVARIWRRSDSSKQSDGGGAVDAKPSGTP
ncbi:MAG: PBP1A family penicillin-binding protein [Bryobacteraceae bacterium]|nr:PBP1A family penicillin-binding protein [Bryobacteraceae bacterium]